VKLPFLARRAIHTAPALLEIRGTAGGTHGACGRLRFLVTQTCRLGHQAGWQPNGRCNRGRDQCRHWRWMEHD